MGIRTLDPVDTTEAILQMRQRMTTSVYKEGREATYLAGASRANRSQCATSPCATPPAPSCHTACREAIAASLLTATDAHRLAMPHRCGLE